MGIPQFVKKISQKMGSNYEVYDMNGVHLGTDQSFINPIKRSANENIAQFGREGLFHFKTLLKPGVIVKDEDPAYPEEFFVSARRKIKLQKSIVVWSVFLVKINTFISISRSTMELVDPTTFEHKYNRNLLASNVPAYLQKEDWTLETTTPIGREQKGYENLIVQENVDIIKGDFVNAEGNLFIVQYLTPYRKDGYLQMQLGIDVK